MTESPDGGLRPAPRNLAGIGWMLLATVFVAVMHSLVRHVAALGIHPFEIAFFRVAFGVVVVVPWLVRYGIEPLRTKRLGLHTVRAVLNTVSMLMFFTAVTLAPLAQITALSFTAPIFATALAVFAFGERVGIHRWTAIVIGFVGTVVVLRPDMATIGAGPVLAVLATLGWSVVILIIKVLARSEASVTIATYMSVLMAPMALLPALFVWTWPSAWEFVLLAAIGILGNSGQIAFTQAVKIADTHVVMPIDFLKLIWVSAIAYVFFTETPDTFTYVGGALVFGCGFYIAYRERAHTRGVKRDAA